MRGNVISVLRGKLRKHIRYGRTPSGRKRFVRDSLSDGNPWHVEALIYLVLLPIIIVLAVYVGAKWLYFKITRP